MIIKSPRRYQCLTFNPNSEICYYDPRECIGQINDDHIIVYCNVELNSKLPGTNPIVKLYSLIQINHYKIYGTIFVENISYHKSVTIKYTTDNWNSFCEKNCNFVKSINSEMDMFEFENDMYFLSNVEFVIKYHVNGHEYYDNNNNKNYIINSQENNIMDGLVYEQSTCEELYDKINSINTNINSLVNNYDLAG